MSKAPAMPMYWDAYIADTTHLSTEEHGAYLLLLAAMWRRDGSVPDNDKDIARIVGLTVAKWRRVRERLSENLVFDGHTITQKNLQKIWKNTQEKIEKNKQNGALGGRPKANETKDITKANGFVSLNPNETIPDPYPYPEPNYIDTDVSITPIVPKVSKPKMIAGKFEEFWSIYPKKQSRGQAESAYAKANKQTDHDEIISGLHRSIQCDHRFQNKQYTPMASTWLNAKGYFDDFSGTNNQTRRGGGSNQHTQSSGSQRQRTGYELAMAAVANLEERERMDGFNPDGRLL
jgi:uncharacterized protein YdaU (DUF1376 family)